MCGIKWIGIKRRPQTHNQQLKFRLFNQAKMYAKLDASKISVCVDFCITFG